MLQRLLHRRLLVLLLLAMVVLGVGVKLCAQEPTLSDRIPPRLERIAGALHAVPDASDPRPLLEEAGREAAALDGLLAEIGRRVAEAGSEVQRTGLGEVVGRARGAVAGLHASIEQALGGLREQGELAAFQIQAMMSTFNKTQRAVMSAAEWLKLNCPLCDKIARDWKG